MMCLCVCVSVCLSVHVCVCVRARVCGCEEKNLDIKLLLLELLRTMYKQLISATVPAALLHRWWITFVAFPLPVCCTRALCLHVLIISYVLYRGNLPPLLNSSQVCPSNKVTKASPGKQFSYLSKKQQHPFNRQHLSNKHDPPVRQHLLTNNTLLSGNTFCQTIPSCQATPSDKQQPSVRQHLLSNNNLLSGNAF